MSDRCPECHEAPQVPETFRRPIHDERDDLHAEVKRLRARITAVIRFYCRWYDDGRPPKDGAGAAYEMVTMLRGALLAKPRFKIGDKVVSHFSVPVGEVLNVNEEKGVLVRWPPSGGENVKPCWDNPDDLRLAEPQAPEAQETPHPQIHPKAHPKVAAAIIAAAQSGRLRCEAEGRMEDSDPMQRCLFSVGHPETGKPDIHWGQGGAYGWHAYLHGPQEGETDGL